MANQDDAGKTTINVKGVDQSSWELAKRLATQSGDNMGVWLSQMINQVGEMAKNGIAPPAKPADPLTADQKIAALASIAAVTQGVAAAKAAGARTIGSAAASALIKSLISGVDPLTVNRSVKIGIESRIERKPGMIIEDQSDPITH